MTIETSRPDNEMDSLTVRLSEDHHEWLERLEASGLFASRTEVVREGVRRLHVDATPLRDLPKEWRTSSGEKLNMRAPDGLLEVINGLDRAGKALNAAHGIRVAIAVVAEVYLDDVEFDRPWDDDEADQEESEPRWTDY